MDAKFLELLGNILVGSARNTQQSEQFFQWLQSGFADMGSKKPPWEESGGNEIFDLFRSWYGLEELSKQPSEYGKVTEEAFSKFNDSLKDSFLSMGFVPRKEHLELVEKYEKLKAKHAELEETVEHLKMLLQGQSDMADQFKDMVNQQGEVYQEMMDQFGTLFSSPDKKS